jgi:hypothetical protein
MFKIIAETDVDLDQIGVAEGCSTTTTCSSLDISSVEFE